MENLKHSMYLVLGDWSDDGHGKSEKELYLCNYPVEAIQQAYKDSCKLTGVSFNHNEDFTGVDRHWSQAGKYRIATEYEQGGDVHEYAGEILKEFDVPEHLLFMKNYGSGYYTENFEGLWWWFVSLSLPGLKYKQVQDEIPVINGYWNENLNVQFGYGLYY